MRVGQGFDVHALVTGRKLVLGGVTRGLLRHMTVPVLMSH